MSSITPTNPNLSLQGLAVSAIPAKDTLQPEGVVKNAETSALDSQSDDKVDLSAEAQAEIKAQAWERFQIRHAAAFNANEAEFKETGDRRTYETKSASINREYYEFMRANGPRPKTDYESKMAAWFEKQDDLEKQRFAVLQQLRHYADIDTKDAQDRPKYAVIKDAVGRVVGHIDQNGGASIDGAAMGLFGGEANYTSIMKSTAGAPNPAQARFDALSLALLNGQGTIELTGAEYRPFASRFTREISALSAQLQSIDDASRNLEI